MTDAWHETQQAIRALRKRGDIRYRLIEAYRALVKIRGKDLPNEVRRDHEWLMGATSMQPAARTCAEIYGAVMGMSSGQLSEAVHRIVRLHEALRRYQPVIVPTPQKQAACRALLRREGRTELGSNTCVDCAQCRLF